MSRKIRQQICANCKHSFKEGENFCPNCGQDNHRPNQPIQHYFSELVESLLHLDSKVLVTIITLLRYPGKLTKEYNENMRARYTPPIRLYFFISFVFFVLLQIPGKFDENMDSFNPDESETVDTKDSLANSKPLDSLFNITINDTIKKEKNHFQIYQADAKKSGVEIFGVKFKKEEILKYKYATDSQIDSILISRQVSPNYFYRTLFKQVIKTIDIDKDFKLRVKEKAIHFASMSLFLLMPFFAFLISITYSRRNKNYYEYLIFSVNYHTVAFLFFSLIVILNFFIKVPNLLYWLYFFGLFFYLGKALRYNFQGSRKRTILKMIFISFVYSIVSFIVLILALIVGWWFV